MVRAIFFAAITLAFVSPTNAIAAAICPADLTAWQSALGAQWIDCHRVADLTTTGQPVHRYQQLDRQRFSAAGIGHAQFKIPIRPRRLCRDFRSTAAPPLQIWRICARYCSDQSV